MAQHSIVQLAKQGDPRAIAYLVTQTLKRYGITARATLEGCCLKLLLEAELVPHQATMMKLIAQGMQKLNIPKINSVKLYGRKLGQAKPAWRQIIELVPAAPTELPQFAPSDALAASPNGSAPPDQAEAPIFQLNDLDPDAVILLPVPPPVQSGMQLDDLDPDAMILFPVEPESLSAEKAVADSSVAGDADRASSENIATARITELAAAQVLTGAEADEILAVRLPRRLSRILLSLLGLQIGINSLLLLYSLLSAGSFSLYTGLDLSNTNQPFASLLAAVVGMADLLFAPLARFGVWMGLLCIGLSLWWLYHLHHSLRGLFGTYPITAAGAVARFVVPLYNLWGIGSTLLTVAKYFKVASLVESGQKIRQLTVWFYLLLLGTVGLQSFYIWLINALPNTAPSLWFYVLRDCLVWLLVIVWFRLVRVIWKAVRLIYQAQVAAVLPAPESKLRRPRRVNLRAVLLGGGASLLSLVLFNCLLGLIATAVFVSNDLPPESILPTFYDSESLLTLVLIGSCLCVGLGGFVTALLAVRASMLHAFGLGIFLTLIGLLLQQSSWISALAELPFWFQTASTVMIIPAALVGGSLRQWFRSL